ncbi:glycerophosphodiester phosphodiesterase 1 [Calliopsis andreniformis]|uniref:glycerophosphodiester phosphodiesterase 1 n=1 Tax=Calliopsis andreniformis TaxID=337506 RepID=UPI003FCD8D49
MHGFLELILNSAVLWIFLQAIWNIFISVFYNFSVPWIAWCGLVITIGLKLVRVPPPNSAIVQEVLGVDPFLLDKDNNLSKDHGNGEQYCMRVVAHRGAAYDFPENSLMAFRNSKDRGCSAVEIDLSLTKDNIPIVFHDPTIDRITGKVGIVKDMTWDQLKDLDITHNHPLKDKFTGGATIALFHDVLELCLNNEQRIIIDIKETKTEIVQIMIDAYKKFPKLYKKAVVSSFNPIIVYLIRRKDPQIVSSLAWRPQFFSRTAYSGLECPGPTRYDNPFKNLAACTLDRIYEWALDRFVFYIVGISVVLLHKDIINPRVIHEWRDRNVRVMAWTVNLPSEKQHFSRLLKITYLTDTLMLENDM